MATPTAEQVQPLEWNDIERQWSLGFTSGKLERRERWPTANIIHTTGSGPYTLWRDNPEKFSSPFDAALHLYTRVMSASGHFLVGQQSRQIVQLCPIDCVAWHVGSLGYKRNPLRYKRRWWKTGRARWWPNRFPHLDSPLDLCGGLVWLPPGPSDRPSCNYNTIGIEVAPPERGARETWSDECWANLVALIRLLSITYNIPVLRETVLSHSEVHPLPRSTMAGRPWDPGPKQWNRERWLLEWHREVPRIASRDNLGVLEKLSIEPRNR